MFKIKSSFKILLSPQILLFFRIIDAIIQSSNICHLISQLFIDRENFIQNLSEEINCTHDETNQYVDRFEQLEHAKLQVLLHCPKFSSLEDHFEENIVKELKESSVSYLPWETIQRIADFSCESNRPIELHASRLFLDINICHFSSNDSDNFLKRLIAICRIHHKSIFRIRAFSMSPDLSIACVLTERSKSTTLSEKINQNGLDNPLSWQERLIGAYHIANVLCLFDESDLIHGRVQPDNISIDDKHNFTLGCVDLVKFNESRTKENVSIFGSLLFLLMYGKYENDDEMALQIVKSELNDEWNEYFTRVFSPEIAVKMKELAIGCLEKNMSMRSIATTLQGMFASIGIVDSSTSEK